MINPTKLFMLFITCLPLCFNAVADEEQSTTSSLATKIQITRDKCSGISDSMSDMKRLAGINTAVTGVGTVTGGVALASGAIKNKMDTLIDPIEQELQDMINKQETKHIYVKVDASELGATETLDFSIDVDQAYTTYQSTSKKLGDIRTGTLATSAITDTAGTIIATKNHINDDLQQRINDCIAAINDLHNTRLRARTENTAAPSELAQSEVIERMCFDWKNVDLSVINKRGTVAAISSGAGAAMAVAGTITSASANSNSVRTNNTPEGKDKEKNLNTASNILAGGTTVASGVATIFNATQISAIKKIVAVADKCEEALK